MRPTGVLALSLGVVLLFVGSAPALLPAEHASTNSTLTDWLQDAVDFSSDGGGNSTYSRRRLQTITGLASLKFGQYQFGDTQWSGCASSATCTISRRTMGLLYKVPSTSGSVSSWPTGSYAAFTYNPSGNAAYPWLLQQYSSSDTVLTSVGQGKPSVISSTGNAFFFLGSDANTGSVVLVQAASTSTAGFSFTGTLNPTVAQVDAFAVSYGSSTPLSVPSNPTAAPTPAPTAPTRPPTPAPSSLPTPTPSAAPTPAPSQKPTAAPSPAPSPLPTPAPTAPSPMPTARPSLVHLLPQSGAYYLATFHRDVHCRSKPSGYELKLLNLNQCYTTAAAVAATAVAESTSNSAAAASGFPGAAQMYSCRASPTHVSVTKAVYGSAGCADGTIVSTSRVYHDERCRQGSGAGGFVAISCTDAGAALFGREQVVLQSYTAEQCDAGLAGRFGSFFAPETALTETRGVFLGVCSAHTHNRQVQYRYKLAYLGGDGFTSALQLTQTVYAQSDRDCKGGAVRSAVVSFPAPVNGACTADPLKPGAFYTRVKYATKLTALPDWGSMMSPSTAAIVTSTPTITSVLGTGHKGLYTSTMYGSAANCLAKTNSWGTSFSYYNGQVDKTCVSLSGSTGTRAAYLKLSCGAAPGINAVPYASTDTNCAATVTAPSTGDYAGKTSIVLGACTMEANMGNSYVRYELYADDNGVCT